MKLKSIAAGVAIVAAIGLSACAAGAGNRRGVPLVARCSMCARTGDDHGCYKTPPRSSDYVEHVQAARTMSSKFLRHGIWR